MNDFLQNLRSGRDKRFERGRRQYINPQYKDAEWRNGNTQKKGGYRKYGPQEQVAAIKPVLEEISKNQERFAIAEERIADAIERIADSLKQFTASGVARPETDGIYQETVPELDATAQDEEDAEKINHADRDEVVHTILDMRKNGATYGKIAEHLEANQIVTFSGKGKWCAQTIHRLYRQNTNEEIDKEEKEEEG